MAPGPGMRIQCCIDLLLQRLRHAEDALHALQMKEQAQTHKDRYMADVKLRNRIARWEETRRQHEEHTHARPNGDTQYNGGGHPVGLDPGST